MANYSAHRAARVKRRGPGALDQDSYRQLADERKWQQREQKLAKLQKRVEDATIPVPDDLTVGMMRTDGELTEEDWQEARRDVFDAKPSMKLKMLRVIFFRSLDQESSFANNHQQTRITVLYLCFCGRQLAEEERAYLDAVAEHQYTPMVFTARERYIVMWKGGKPGRFHATQGVVRRYKAQVKEMQREVENARLGPIAAAALEIMDEDVLVPGGSVAEAEMDDIAREFEAVALNVRRAFDIGDLERKMKILKVADGEVPHGMDVMLGL